MVCGHTRRCFGTGTCAHARLAPPLQVLPTAALCVDTSERRRHVYVLSRVVTPPPPSLAAPWAAAPTHCQHSVPRRRSRRHGLRAPGGGEERRRRGCARGTERWCRPAVHRHGARVRCSRKRGAAACGVLARRDACGALRGTSAVYVTAGERPRVRRRVAAASCTLRVTAPLSRAARDGADWLHSVAHRRKQQPCGGCTAAARPRRRRGRERLCAQLPVCCMADALG